MKKVLLACLMCALNAQAITVVARPVVVSRPAVTARPAPAPAPKAAPSYHETTHVTPALAHVPVPVVSRLSCSEERRNKKEC